MPKEDGHKNLKPIRSEEEARIKGKKGGIASGKARLAKKTAREYAIAALEGVVKGKDGNTTTVKDVMIQKLIAKAVGESDLLRGQCQVQEDDYLNVVAIARQY